MEKQNPAIRGCRGHWTEWWHWGYVTNKVYLVFLSRHKYLHVGMPFFLSAWHFFVKLDIPPLDVATDYNLNSVINAKIVTKRWKRKVKVSPPNDPTTRRDSSLVGVFSAINISKRWKNKINQKHEESRLFWGELILLIMTKKKMKKL